jgi:hypothetical protein
MTTFPKALLSEADYFALEDALLSNEKGRRFLRAYVDRNRGMETLRLLRSISRMHRAALGVPGANSEVCRDLTGVLRIISIRKEAAASCQDEAAKSKCLSAAIEEIEACVITLIESIEDKMANSLQDSEPFAPHLDSPLSLQCPDRTAKLFGELSSYFSAEPR